MYLSCKRHHAPVLAYRLDIEKPIALIAEEMPFSLNLWTVYLLAWSFDWHVYIIFKQVESVGNFIFSPTYISYLNFLLAVQ